VAHRAISTRTDAVPTAERRTIIRASYDDGEQLVKAFAGLERLFLMSTADAPEQRRRRHRSAIAAARSVGVSQIIFLSLRDALPDSPFPFAAANHDAELSLRSHSGIDWTILHPNIYAEAIFEMGGGDLQRGVLTFPWAGARVGYVSRADIAEVAASLLVSGGGLGETLEITGPRALTLEDVCQELSAALQRSIEARPDSLESYRKKLEAFLPADTAAAFGGLCQALADGRFDVASDVVQRRTGRDPQSVFEVSRALANARA
jgi:uncharacterized protein YbjT (DUF2867 family)